MGIGNTAKHLATWQQHGLITDEQVKRITEYESASQKDGSFSRLIMLLGSFSLVLGFLAIIGANWNSIPDVVKLIAHSIISLGLAAGFYIQRDKKGWEKDIFLLLIFGTNLSFIALIGQVFQLQGHPFFAVLTWLVVSTPLLLMYATTRFVAYAWVIGICIKNILLTQWLSNKGLMPSQTATLITTAVSAAYFLLSHIRWVDNRFPLFTKPIRQLSTLGIVVSASALQLFWRVEFDADHFTQFWNHASSIWVTIIAYVIVVLLSAQKKAIWDFKPALWFFGASILAILAPIVFTHPAIPLLGAMCFIAYWVALGYASYMAGERRYLDLVIWVISIRLFIVYLELFGTLASTGIGLMLGGVIFLGLGWGARKMQKYLGAKHV